LWIALAGRLWHRLATPRRRRSGADLVSTVQQCAFFGKSRHPPFSTDTTVAAMVAAGNTPHSPM